MKDAPDAEAAAAKKVKEVARVKEVAKVEEVVVEEPETLDSDIEMDEADDQTEALLKGFESDESDDEMEEEVDSEKIKELGQFEPSKAVRKQLRKAEKAAKEAALASAPGVVYLGRIPHGFYENEMREYFKQFGDILKLRLSRNKKTGRSKHYAFIQFSSGDVASIVAKTMDNYLLFGHILKCKVVPAEQIHEGLWEGANKRFKKVPWNKMEGRKLEMGMTEAGWDKRAEKEKKRREKKAEEMKKLGYSFEAPALKSAKDVEKRPIEQIVLTTEEDEMVVDEPVVEEPKVEEKKPEVKATRKSKRKSDVAAVEEPKVEEKKPAAKKSKRKAEEEIVVAAVEEPSKKKRKASSAAETVVEKKGKATKTAEQTIKKAKKSKA